MNEQAGRMPRDESIDVVRGLAIVTMIYANSAGYILAEPHSLASRLFGTFAAPLFIFVAGMMVGLSSDVKNYSFTYFLQRGLLVILTSALVIDVLIWKRVPFISMEVLYLIGIAIPLTALLHRRQLSTRCIVTGLVFAVAPLLRWKFGYEEQPWYFELTDYANLREMMIDVAPFLHTDYLEQQFIDGAFPLFPWLGFAFAGSLLATYRWRGPVDSIRTCSSRRWLGGSVALLAFGVWVWWLDPGPLFVRMGFSEMFYPPQTGYVLTAGGVIGLVFWFVDGNPRQQVYEPIRLLGQCSLFIYVLQWILAEHVLYPAFPDMTASVAQHFAWYIGVLTICVLAALAARTVKRRWQKMPFLIRFFLGT